MYFWVRKSGGILPNWMTKCDPQTAEREEKMLNYMYALKGNTIIIIITFINIIIIIIVIIIIILLLFF